jgi:hypothetical protein
VKNALSPRRRKEKETKNATKKEPQEVPVAIVTTPNESLSSTETPPPAMEPKKKPLSVKTMEGKMEYLTRLRKLSTKYTGKLPATSSSTPGPKRVANNKLAKNGPEDAFDRHSPRGVRDLPSTDHQGFPISSSRSPTTVPGRLPSSPTSTEGSTLVKEDPPSWEKMRIMGTMIGNLMKKVKESDGATTQSQEEAWRELVNHTSTMASQTASYVSEKGKSSAASIIGTAQRNLNEEDNTKLGTVQNLLFRLGDKCGIGEDAFPCGRLNTDDRDANNVHDNEIIANDNSSQYSYSFPIAEVEPSKIEGLHTIGDDTTNPRISSRLTHDSDLFVGGKPSDFDYHEGEDGMDSLDDILDHFTENDDANDYVPPAFAYTFSEDETKLQTNASNRDDESFKSATERVRYHAAKQGVSMDDYIDKYQMSSDVQM